MQFNSLEEFVQFAKNSTQEQFVDVVYEFAPDIITQLCMQSDLQDFVELLNANEISYTNFLEGIVLAQFNSIYNAEKLELQNVSLIGAIVTELQRFGLQSNVQGLQGIFALVQQLIARVQNKEQIVVDAQMPTVIAGD